MHVFNGVKIVDLTRVFSGPFATRHFADLGAEVIKVEPPKGDDSRYFPPLVNGWSGYFEILNRGKKSIFLDLKNNQDLDSLYSLCRDADVFVENYSLAVKEKLKIDYPTIKNINPKIIYASVTGISEHVDRKYYDVIGQAESGLISLNGSGEDMKISTAIVDAFSGMKLAFAISSALFYKQKTGNGLKISVSMKGSAFDLLEQNLIEASITGKNPDKVGNMDSAIASFGIFKTKDGLIAIACGNDKLWNVLSDFLTGFVSFDTSFFVTNGDRVKNLSKLIEIIENVFTHHTTDSLKIQLASLGVPCGKVMKMTDVLADQENYTEGLLYKVKHPIAGAIVEPCGGIFIDD